MTKSKSFVRHDMRGKEMATGEDIEKIQDNIDTMAKPIIDSLIVNGVIVEDAILEESKVNEVRHSLGRVPRGYIVIYKNANATVWDSQKGSPRFLYLVTSVEATVSLWVF